MRLQDFNQLISWQSTSVFRKFCVKGNLINLLTVTTAKNVMSALSPMNSCDTTDDYESDQ